MNSIFYYPIYDATSIFFDSVKEELPHSRGNDKENNFTF
jgi:hypothetical protein